MADAVTEMSDGQILTWMGTDAQRWAETFAQLHDGDPSLMIGWFANAIEAGRLAAGHSADWHLLAERLRNQHLPNTPRTHDASGRELHEAVQCRRCLQQWPCEIRRLLDG